MVNNLKDILVSVLIPAYNQEKFIANCIESVRLQTYSQLQIIIGDDYSTDNTYSIIKSLALDDSRIEHYSNEKNIGICANFNKLFDKVKGDYVVFFSGDDIMHSNKIELQLKCFERNKRLVLVHHDADIINENSEITRRHLKGHLPLINPLDYSLKVDFFHFHKFAFFMPTTCMARTEYFLHARYNNRLRYKHELLFYLENYYAFPDGQWGYINRPLIQYRDHPENFTHNPEFAKFLNAEKFKLADLASEYCPGLVKRIRKYISFTCYDIKLFNFFDVDNKQEKIDKIFTSNANIKDRFLFIVARLLKKAGLYWWNSKLLYSLFYKPIYNFKYHIITKQIFN